MVGRLQFDVDAEAFERAAKAVPRALRLSLGFRMKRIGAEFEREMDENRLSGRLSGPFRRNLSMDRVAARTGMLRRSLRYRVDDPRPGQGAEDMRLIVNIGNAQTAHYAFIQEYGGTIRPKTSRYLTIPMPANLTPAGVTRFKARELDNLFVLRSGGKLFLARREESGVVIYFLLKREVKIPPRLGFEKTWASGQMRQLRRREVEAGVIDALAKVGLS